MISRFFKEYFNLSSVQRRRLKLNFTATSLGLSIRMLAQILFPPLMIIVWGVENFGMWIFLLSLPNLLNMVNFNFIESAKQDMIFFYNKKKSDKVQTIFQCSILLTLGSITFFLILSLIFYILSDFSFNATTNLPSDILRMSFVIVVITICLHIFDGILISTVSIKGLTYLVEYNRIIFDTMLKATLIVAGLFFKNFFVLVLIFFTFKVIQTVIFTLLYMKHRDNLKISFNKISKTELYRQFKLSLSYNFEIISEIINNNGLIFALGIFFNANIIAVVSTCKTLFYFFPRQVFAILNQASFYEYAASFAKRETKNIIYNFKKHLKLVSILAVLFVFLSFVFGPFIYKLWLNARLGLNYNLIYLIILISFLDIIYNTIIIPQRSINQFFKFTIFRFIVSAIALIISLLLFYLSFQFITYFYILLILNFFSITYSIFHVNKFFRLQSKKTENFYG